MKTNAMKLPFLALIVAAVGCGDADPNAFVEGPNGPNGPTTPELEVLDTTPVDGDVSVAPDSVISVELDEELDSDSIDASAFALRTARGQVIAGTVDLAGPSTIRFTPDSVLPLTTPFEATLNTEVASRSGRGFAADYIWRFTTRDGTWSTPDPVNGTLSDGLPAEDLPPATDDQSGSVEPVGSSQDDGTPSGSDACSDTTGTDGSECDRPTGETHSQLGKRIDIRDSRDRHANTETSY